MDQVTPLVRMMPAECAMLVLDEVGRVISSTSAARQLLGLSLEQLAQSNCQVPAANGFALDGTANGAATDVMVLPGDGVDGLVVKGSVLRLETSGGDPLTLLLLAPQGAGPRSGLQLGNLALTQVAQEIHTPLCAIAGYLDLLLARYRPIRRAELDKTLHVLRRHTALVEHLVGNLLTALSASQGSYQLDIKPLNVTEVIEEAVGTVGILAEGKRQTITLVLPSGEAVVHADRVGVVQALTNVLLTVIRRMGENAHITLSAAESSGYWQISVSDNGLGLPWWQGDGVDSRDPAARPDETDLGIAIVKAVIERHGGQIGLTSSTENGNIFWFTLPGERCFEPDR